MSMKTTAITTDALVEDIRRVKEIKDGDIGGSGSTMVSVDWQQQCIVDFPCFQFDNSNTVSSLYIR